MILSQIALHCHIFVEILSVVQTVQVVIKIAIWMEKDVFQNCNFIVPYCNILPSMPWNFHFFMAVFKIAPALRALAAITALFAWAIFSFWCSQSDCMIAATSSANLAAISCTQMRRSSSFASTISLLQLLLPALFGLFVSAIWLDAQMDIQKEWQCRDHPVYWR